MSWLGIAGGAGFVVLMLLLGVGSIAFGATSLLSLLISPGGTPVPAP